jgi:phosphoenolpyruvate synthase/pyruvate phosphate dikinase
VDNNICVNAEKIKDVLSKIDDKIKETAKKYLDISDEEMRSVYIPILKSEKYLVLSIGSNTVLFEGEISCDDKNEIKNKLKKGNYIRYILSFKKVNFKHNEIKCLVSIVQIEKA